MIEKIRKSDEEWAAQLTIEQFRVAREKGTEMPFSGKYWDHHENGIYACACCALDLFDSADKVDSGTGWPSFTKAVSDENVEFREDRSFFMRRTEVLCARCEAHLGHVFDDGSGGRSYCINSASLEFKPR